MDGRGRLQCPIHPANNPFELRYEGLSYVPSVSVIQPCGVEGINAFAETYGVPLGCAGGVGLGMQFRVLPLDVSFSQISIEEVPSTVGYHTGYFANSYLPTHGVTHAKPGQDAGRMSACTIFAVTSWMLLLIMRL